MESACLKNPPKNGVAFCLLYGLETSVLMTSVLLSPAVVVPALHLLSGLSNSVPITAYNRLQIDDAAMQPATRTVVNEVIGALPWDFKIFVAFLSAWMPLFRRRRVPYLCIAIVVQIVERILIGTRA